MEGDFEETKKYLGGVVATYLSQQLDKQKHGLDLKKHLIRLKRDNSDGLIILTSICKNIVNNPNETKFHTLKKSNQKLSKVIDQDVKLFLKEAGFKETDESFQFDPEQLSYLKETWRILETFNRTPEDRKKEFLHFVATFTSHVLSIDQEYIDFDSTFDIKEKRDSYFIYFIRALHHSGLTHEKTLEFVDHFIAKGVEVSNPNYILQFDQKIMNFVAYGGTPLTVCMGLHSILGLEVLVERGADLNAEDPIYHMTPLCIACIKKGHSNESHLLLLDFLLNNGAEPNKKTKTGLSPLGYAVTQGTYEIVEKLLEAGATITVEEKLTSDFRMIQILEKHKN